MWNLFCTNWCEICYEYRFVRTIFLYINIKFFCVWYLSFHRGDWFDAQFTQVKTRICVFFLIKDIDLYVLGVCPFCQKKKIICLIGLTWKRFEWLLLKYYNENMKSNNLYDSLFCINILLIFVIFYVTIRELNSESFINN